MGVVDLGASNIYIAPSASHGPTESTTTTVCVVTATGQVQRPLATSSLPIPPLANHFPITGHIMPKCTNTLIGVGPIYDAKCAVLFTKQDVMIISPTVKSILRGW